MDSTTYQGKTAVLYARYSSDKQRDASIDDQIRVCRDFCAREGIRVVGQYCDHALSGTNDRRPEFRRMIANAPESDLVVVYMFDRFSRDRYDTATYKRMLRECGVRVLSATEKVEDTPEGGLQEGLLEILSEYYVKDLARKIRRGLEGNALKAMDNGNRIFGYRTDPVTRRYVIEPVEAQAVRDIYAKYIGGETIYTLAKLMASEGWVTNTGRAVDYNWISRILTRKAYTGVYKWDGIEVEGGMPQIIDKRTFQMARDRAAMNHGRSSQVWADYRLSGRLYCGLCGQPMHGYGGTSHTGRRYHYYGCKENGGCHRRGIRRELIEDAYADAVLKVCQDEKSMRRLARQVVAAQDRDDGRKAQAENCAARIDELERERHNITRAVRQGFVNEEMIERNLQIGDEIAALESKKAELEADQVVVTEQDVIDYLAHGFDRNDDLIFNVFANRVYVFDDYMIAILNFRGADIDLAEVRAALGLPDGQVPTVLPADARKSKNPSPQGGLGSVLRGVSDNPDRELVVLHGGIGLRIPFDRVA